MKTDKQRVGAWGEKLACQHLQKKGYEIVCTNYQTRVGEIDIIAWHEKPFHGKTLCFVEVKTRSSQRGSGARAAGRYEKLRAIKRTAHAYCMERDVYIDSTPIQFEYIGIFYSALHSNIHVDHFTISVD
jgi:putative endonuclease